MHILLYTNDVLHIVYRLISYKCNGYEFPLKTGSWVVLLNCSLVFISFCIRIESLQCVYTYEYHRYTESLYR